jgi:hypothetical protein
MYHMVINGVHYESSEHFLSNVDVCLQIVEMQKQYDVKVKIRFLFELITRALHIPFTLWTYNDVFISTHIAQ